MQLPHRVLFALDRLAATRVALVGGALLACTGAALAQGGSLPFVPQDPVKYQPGAVTIRAQPGMVTVLQSGQVFTTYTGCGTQPITNAVAFALRIAQPGSVIGVWGMHPGITLKPNPNGCQQNEVGWAGNAVIHDVDIVGEDPTATIDGVVLYGDYLTPGQAGVDRITFSHLRLRNSPGETAPLYTGQESKHGLVRLYDSVIEPMDPTAWDGHGMKWGSRTFKTSLDFRGNNFYGALEHGIAYNESIGEDGVYPFSGVFLDNICTATDSGRTCIQNVSRKFPIAGSAYESTGGKGTVLIRRNVMSADAGQNDGGSVVTVVGHLGNVFIQDNDITANDSGPPGGENEGGIVFWTDDSPSHGAILNAAGFSTTYAYIAGNTIHGTGTNPCVAASGCQVVNVGVNTFAMGGVGVAFDTQFGGPIPNGKEYLPPSTMAGWLQGGAKATDGGIVLTDAQIDNRY